MSELFAGILAAGRGSRLGLTTMPKPMVDIGGKPVMSYALEALYKSSFTNQEIFCAIGHIGHTIIDFFQGDLQYVDANFTNGNAESLERIYQILRKSESPPMNLLIIQADDSLFIDSNNIQELIRFHLAIKPDISLITTNIPDVETHRFELVYGREDRIIDFIPRKSIDSNSGYIVGSFIFSMKFLDIYLPLIKETHDNTKELGIADLLRFAIKSELEVFGIQSKKAYVSINTPEGLHRARSLYSQK